MKSTMKTLLRFGNYAMGVYDDRNFFIATYGTLGEKAKPEKQGQEVLKDMVYHNDLERCCNVMIRKIATAEGSNESVRTLCQLRDAVTAAVSSAADSIRETLGPERITPAMLCE